MKSGANNLAHASLLGMVTNLPLMGGYALYGISTVLLVMALKDGELSLLYPVISLTYVWVTALSFLLFNETVNPFKLVGIAAVVCGVGVLGRGNGKPRSKPQAAGAVAAAAGGGRKRGGRP